MIKMIPSIITVTLLFATISTLHADTIYKSIDENGRVSYSSTPPDKKDDTSEVSIAPPPSDEQVKAAQEQYEQHLRTGEMLEENRKKRNEITAEENRLKRERQEQSQQETQSENDESYGYPYYRRPRPRAISVPAQRPALPAR